MLRLLLTKYHKYKPTISYHLSNSAISFHSFIFSQRNSLSEIAFAIRLIVYRNICALLLVLNNWIGFDPH